MTKFFTALLLAGLALAAAPARAQLYTIKTTTAVHNRQPVAALRVVVDGREEATRDYLQEFMKTNYNVRLKPKGLLGTGKKDELSALQVPNIGSAGRPLDLYVNLNEPTDSTTEVALFGGFGDKAFFDTLTAASEFASLRLMLDKFLPAARAHAYAQQVKDAEATTAALDRQGERLQHSIQSAKTNTTANLKRMDELRRQNQTNAQQVTQDSTQLLGNTQLAEAARLHLQRRRERLATAPK